MREYDLVAVLDGTHGSPPAPEVQMVTHGGLTAVLAAAPRPAMRLLQSRREMMLEAATRLRWQEACLPLGTLLPAQANCSLSHGGAVAFLQANQPQLSRLMRRFAGHVQVQVTVSWQEDGVLARFRDSPELAPLFTEGRSTPAALTEAITRLSSRLSEGIGHQLASVGIEISQLPVTSSVLWNGAVLVPLSGLEALSGVVEAIDAIWSEGLQIRQIGPAPVGSFVTLELDRITGPQAKKALNAFGSSAGHAAERRAALLAAMDDMTLREAIRAEARIAEAAARLPIPAAGFSLARIRAEGLSGGIAPHRAVA